MTDRDVTRFLWVKDIELPHTPDNTEILRFTRVPFGVISSPYLLSATIGQHLAKQENPLADDIRKNTYVDNVLGGVDSVENAIKYYQEAKEMFNSASMNLREWTSNNDEFVASLPEADRSEKEKVKVLGMEWNTKKDTINVASNEADTKLVKTKRDLLRVIASFYDPLGYFSPIMLKAKSLLQTVWKLDIGWDEQLPDEVIEQWKKIAIEMRLASNTDINRCTVSWTASSQYELHVFCDASKVGFGAVAYLREIDGSVNVICSKTRVAPVKEMSIPRLELLAVLMGTKLAKFLEKELPLKLEKTYVWSDSQCTLAWLKNTTRKLPTFVANRVKEIRSYEGVKFQYVGSAHNPADHASRGANVSELKRGLWWNGPSWLRDNSAWPVGSDNDGATPVTVNFVHGEGPIGTPAMIDRTPAGIDPERFSSFSKLVRVTAYVQKIVDKIRKKPVDCSITTEEYRRAELKWLLFTQEQHYSSEIKALKDGKSTDLGNKLGLVLDEMGLIRCRGRMQNTKMEHPILLSGKDKLAEQIVRDYHRELLHSGVNHTLNELRKRFWLTRGRETIKRVLKKCLVCKRHEGGPFRMPQLAPLPKERLMASLPFEFTGIDYFGPLNYRGSDGTAKCWVVLFTCLTTRAVHLEVVTDMSTDAFLMAFRRFIARRGVPRKVTSDNAQQFRLASNALNLLWDSIQSDQNVGNYMASKGVEWSFITQLSPWMGGIYERMVQTTKRCLRKCIGRKLLSLIDLITLMTEVEGIVNSRPLTYVADELHTFAITPAKLLNVNPCLSLPQCTVDVNDPDFALNTSSAEFLLQKLGHQQLSLSSYWDQWRDEYLASVRERGDFQLRQQRVLSDNNPTVGSIVIIKEELQPRNTWPLGKITEIQLNKRDEARSATLQLPSGKSITRPLCMLYPLECQGEAATSTESTTDGITDTTDASVNSADDIEKASETTSGDQQSTRPSRRAATQSRLNLQNLIEDGAV